MSEYYVYKWVVNDEIVYIGQTTRPEVRFLQEKRQNKFKPYLDADIFMTKLANKCEMDALEKLLINKYKPVLNVKDKYEESSGLTIDEDKLIWESYNKIEKEDADRCELMRAKQKVKDIEEEIENNSIYDKDIIDIMSMMIRENVHSITLDLERKLNGDRKASLKEWINILNDYDVTYDFKESDVLEWFFYYHEWNAEDETDKTYTFFICAEDDEGRVNYCINTQANDFDDYLEGLQRIYEAADEWEQIKKEDLKQAKLELEELRKRLEKAA